MRSLTENFLNSTGRYHARLVWADGTELGSGSIKSLSLALTLNGSTDRLTLGAAPAARLTAVVTEIPEGIAGQTLRLRLGRTVGGELEEVPLGVYTIAETAAGEDTVTLTGYDAMYTALENGYYPTLTGAATAKAVLADIAAQAGVELAEIAADDVPVSGVATGYTLRELAGYMAALLGGSARMDGEGRLAVGWFSPSGLTVDGTVIYSGGAQLAAEDWTLGKLTCGVTTTTTTTDTDGAGNTITSSTQDTETLTAGEGATGISLSNPWMTQAVLDGIFLRVGGLSYRAGTVSMLGDLRHEVGDLVSVVDASGETHTFPIMAQTIEYDGGLKMTLSAYASAQSAGDTAGPLTTAVQRYAAELAFVRQLMAENLTATTARLGQLDAGKANIEDLTSARAGIDELNARTAVIEAAYITDAEMEEFVADRATVEQLEAATADIDALTAGQAAIQALLAGQAGVGVLEAIHLTGDNVVIDDAVIADAMIAALSADKLTAGTIYTSLIKIASDQQENLVLDGATLQVRDANGVVRVQIGKDGTGDYNLALWGSDGALLWDASGVYAAGLHDGIIRDIAVADDANISGAKLDIASVASRLTEDGTLVVDSGQVTIDGTTLSAAYQTLTQADADAARKTSALETAFEVVQGQVSSKVWQSDIETAVEGIEVGGRNLIRDSSMELGTGWNSYSYVSNTDGMNGGSCFKVDGAFGTTKAVSQVSTIRDSLVSEGFFKPGEQYVVSYWAKAENLIYGTTNKTIGFYIPFSLHGAWVAQVDCVNKIPEGTSNWTRYSAVVTIPTKEFSAVGVAYIYFRDFTGTVYIDNIQLERGNKLTDWTPAPEDTDSAITTLSDRYSTLDQNVDGITAQVGSVETTAASLGERLSSAESTLQQQANQIALKVSQTELDEAVSSVESRLCLGVDSDGTAYLTGEAQRIEFGAEQLIINSDNFTLSEDGSITANNATIYGTVKTETSLGAYTELSSGYLHGFFPFVKSTFEFEIGGSGLILRSEYFDTGLELSYETIIDPRSITTSGSLTVGGDITSGGSKVLTEADDLLHWTQVGSAAGTSELTIPADVWAKAHEFVIEWRLTDNTPWRTMLLPKSSTRAMYVDSYQYSSAYFGCCGFSAGLLNGAYPVTPSAGWASGAFGGTTLTVNDLRYIVYWR